MKGDKKDMDSNERKTNLSIFVKRKNQLIEYSKKKKKKIEQISNIKKLYKKLN